LYQRIYDYSLFISLSTDKIFTLLDREVEENKTLYKKNSPGVGAKIIPASKLFL